METPLTKAVEVQNLTYRYPDGTTALKNINLTVEHGEKVAIIGPNGAGKSTLLLLIGCFLRGEGRVIIDGIENTRSNIKNIRAVLGAVFQNPDEQLFMSRLIDDVAFGPLNMGLSREQALERSNSALATVGLEGLEEKEPHHLSAGQKRAAAIATILSMSPHIITMDEPDSSLDPRSRRNLGKLLKGLSQTLVIATCNMDFAAELCERAVLIDNGEVIAAGDARSIMSDEDLMMRHGLEVPRSMVGGQNQM